MAVDLGTAYISLVPTTKDFDKGIRQALDGSVKHAARAGDSMGEKLSSGISSHLAKAGDKSGDAFGKSFSPRVQSAGKTAMQGLANLMLGSAQGIGGEIGGTISTGLTGALNKGAASAIDSLDAIGTKGGAAMSSKLQTAGMLAAGGVALVGTAAVAATAELYKIGQAWDEVADGITAKTGAIGERLDAITQSVKNVAVETAAAPGDIAAVTAQLVQTLKLSGTDLEKLTKQISDYNAMNADSPLNIRDFAKAMKQFGVGSASEMSDQLDRLNNVAQNTGIPLNSLVESLKMAAPVAKEFKMPLATVTQLLATFEDAGLNAEAAAGALRIALGNIATKGTGEAPAVQLQNIITKIRDLYAAGNETAALDLAKSTFGKSFTQILPLIKDNTLEIGNLDTAIGNLGPTIEEQRQATSDFTEEWRKFRNFLEVELEPVAARVFGGIQNFLSYGIGTIAQNIRDIGTALGGLYEGGNMSTGAALTPGVPAAPGILGGAAGVNPGIGINGGGPGGNAASQILGGAAGAVPGSGVIGTAGRGYFNSRAAAAQLDGRLAAFDNQLLSMFPPGRYDNGAVSDLSQGLADCSSAIEDLINIIDGRPTAGREMTTFNAAEWLTSRGFRPGTAPGAFNVGFTNSGTPHMEATLPGGTNFNYGNSADAARNGRTNSAGAFSPQLDQRYYRYASGGGIRGTGTGTSDSIPALLSNGEHVLTAKDVQAMGGQSGVYSFRNALHGFAEGGAIPLAAIDVRNRMKGGEGEGGQRKKQSEATDLPPIWGDTGPGIVIGDSRMPTGPVSRDQWFLPWWWSLVGGDKLDPLTPDAKRRKNLEMLGLGFAEGGSPDDLIKELGTQHGALQGAEPGSPVDPTTATHGGGTGAPPGPNSAAVPDLTGAASQPANYGMDFVRSMGFIPATAGSNTVAGTSSLANFIDMGASITGGLIDTGVNLGNMAVSAAIAAGVAGGSFGGAAAAAPAAQMAASYGLQLLGNQGKTIANYWFGLAGIGADALQEQLFPFGAPRWLGYDYANFAPQLGIQQAALSTVEKMGTDAISRAFAAPGQTGQPNPGGPVTPATMPGVAQPIAPPPPEGAPMPPPSGPSSAPMPPAGPMPLIPNLMGYDQGGMLPPGGMGINMTSRPEPVLTPQQWDAIAATSSAPAQGAPLVQNLYAQDMQDAIRQLEKVKRRDMMQYAGRP